MWKKNMSPRSIGVTEWFDEKYLHHKLCNSVTRSQPNTLGRFLDRHVWQHSLLLQPIPAERRVKPWTGCQSTTGPTHWDRQQLTLTNNWESLTNLHVFGLLEKTHTNTGRTCQLHKERPLSVRWGLNPEPSCCTEPTPYYEQLHQLKAHTVV